MHLSLILRAEFLDIPMPVLRVHQTTPNLEITCKAVISL